MDLLEKFLKILPLSSKRVKIKPGAGADSAVFNTGSHYIVISQDPITFTEKEIGYYAVLVNANDVLCMGAKPEFFLFTLLLPKTANLEKINKIFKEVSYTCKKLNISVIGGHTEISPGLEKIIISGTMIGLRKKKEGLFPKRVKEGDYLLCVKEVPIEGISIIAKEKEEELKDVIDENLLNKFKNYHRNPGISIFKEALLLLKNKNVLALHDPTEGGIFNGIYEFCEFLNKGVLVYEDRIPVIKKAKKIFELYNIDPLKTISSGCLLVATKRKGTFEIEDILRKKRIKYRIIGEFKKKEFGKKLVLKNGKKIEIYPCQDEISKIF